MNKNTQMLLIAVGLVFISMFIFMATKNPSTGNPSEPDNNSDTQQEEGKGVPEKPFDETDQNLTTPPPRKPDVPQEEPKTLDDLSEVGSIYVKTINDFVRCLVNRGMTIYASRTCPACFALADSFGGYDRVAPLFVECNEKPEKCQAEMKTGYVPEIQINGALYNGPRNLASLAEVTGCEL